ncbi:MAG: translation elongation factor Ts [Gammaproteobacteria bacterium]|nr:translation elongation factor Ts [Gammaproteobacteria bacterium]
MEITAQLVKELRTRTGVGMMECKRALSECDGDIDAAIQHLRTSGQMKADKKSARTAAEGSLALAKSGDGARALLLELNSETDFVAKDEGFLAFAQTCAEAALSSGTDDVGALMNQTVDGGTLEETRRELVARLGENIQARRLQGLDADGASIACYLHGRRIGVLVAFDGEPELGRDLAMHIAASRPVCVNEDEVPEDLLEKEREVLTAQAQESGKPPEIIEKMIAGRLRKYLSEITLLGQPFVKDPDVTVGKLLQSKNASVRAFTRLEVGEGIEKKQENFAEEVRAQAEKH